MTIRWLRSLALGFAGLLLAAPVASGVRCEIGILDSSLGTACTSGDVTLSFQRSFLEQNQTDQSAPLPRSDVALTASEPNLPEPGVDIFTISAVQVSASFRAVTSPPELQIAALYEPAGSTTGDDDLAGGAPHSRSDLLGLLLVVSSALIGVSSLLVAGGFLRPPWQWKRPLKST